MLHGARLPPSVTADPPSASEEPLGTSADIPGASAEPPGPSPDPPGAENVIVILERGMAFAPAADVASSDCPVCLVPLHELPCIKLACGHQLHLTCAQAMEFHAVMQTGFCRCPMCRAVVSRVSVAYDTGSRMLMNCNDRAWTTVNRRVVSQMLRSDTTPYALGESRQITVRQAVSVIDYLSETSYGITGPRARDNRVYSRLLLQQAIERIQNNRRARALSRTSASVWETFLFVQCLFSMHVMIIIWIRFMML